MLGVSDRPWWSRLESGTLQGWGETAERVGCRRTGDQSATDSPSSDLTRRAGIGWTTPRARLWFVATSGH